MLAVSDSSSVKAQLGQLYTRFSPKTLSLCVSVLIPARNTEWTSMTTMSGLCCITIFGGQGLHTPEASVRGISPLGSEACQKQKRSNRF